MDTATRSTPTPAGRARSSRRSGQLYAAEVAAAYAAATAAVDDTQEEILWVTMEIAQHLAERGHAGQWHRIDGVALGRFTLTGDVDDRVCFLRLAAPMLVWLAETRQLDGETVASILESLHAAVASCVRSDRILKRARARLETAMLELAAVPEPIEADTTIPIAVEQSAPQAGLESLDVMVVAPPSLGLRCLDEPRSDRAADAPSDRPEDSPPEAA